MLDIIKFIIILLNGLYIYAFVSEAIKDKKTCHLFIVMSAFCIANVMILWFDL